MNQRTSERTKARGKEYNARQSVHEGAQVVTEKQTPVGEADALSTSSIGREITGKPMGERRELHKEEHAWNAQGTLLVGEE